MSRVKFTEKIRYLFIRIKYKNRIQFANHAIIQNNVLIRVRENGTIKFGKRPSISANSMLSATNGVLEIGDNVFFNRNCNICCRLSVHIGNNCIFGPNCCVFDHDHLIENKVVKKNEYSVSQISIGEGTWIGAGVIILKGAHIGNGCVIGAGCIVKGDIPDYSIVTSNRDLIIKDLY